MCGVLGVDPEKCPSSKNMKSTKRCVGKIVMYLEVWGLRVGE